MTTLAVELDHGRIIFCDGEPLPEKARGLLTILPPHVPARDPLKQDPELRRVRFYEDPTKPLEPGDWPEAFS